MWAKTFPESTFVGEQFLSTKRTVGKNGHVAHPWNHISSCVQVKFNQFKPFWTGFMGHSSPSEPKYHWPMALLFVNCLYNLFKGRKAPGPRLQGKYRAMFREHFCHGTINSNRCFQTGLFIIVYRCKPNKIHLLSFRHECLHVEIEIAGYIFLQVWSPYPSPWPKHGKIVWHMFNWNHDPPTARFGPHRCFVYVA